MKTTSATLKTDLHTLRRAELEELFLELGQPKFRVSQLEQWLWQKDAQNFDELSNLPKSLREALEEGFVLSSVRLLAAQESQDGSRKYLLGFNDGTSVECVGMPTGSHLSVCVSTQAGCAMGCAFCATGAAGLTRSLLAHEIYEQVSFVAQDFGMRASSVVFMGQGEPFANYVAVMEALRVLNDPNKFNIGARHLTVSTCGIIPKISQFAKEPEQFTLAVSLHSANQKTRDYLMPGVKKYSLLYLYDVLGEYVDKTHRRPTYEYALIKGINDTEDELGALVDFCRGTLCHVNLIMLNHVPGSDFLPSSDRRANEFISRLNSVGVEATLRASRGADIDAACGQLKQHLKL